MAELYTLTDHLGPFDENGRVYSEGQLREMFKWLGLRTMRIPRFGTHIIRTNHATAVAMYCVRNYLATHVGCVTSPESDHDSGTQASIAPVVHTKRDVSNKVKEEEVRDALAHGTRGEIA